MDAEEFRLELIRQDPKSMSLGEIIHAITYMESTSSLLNFGRVWTISGNFSGELELTHEMFQTQLKKYYAELDRREKLYKRNSD